MQPGLRNQIPRSVSAGERVCKLERALRVGGADGLARVAWQPGDLRKHRWVGSAGRVIPQEVPVTTQSMTLLGAAEYVVHVEEMGGKEGHGGVQNNYDDTC
ncbi:Host Cell Factor 2 [Manis pentadactyla]|nr:Host Cell Factor 2 [Manis pentadactyla]